MEPVRWHRPLEGARGGSHVVRDNVQLSGDRTVRGAFDATAWTNRSATRWARSGGVWMGSRITGDGWTGSYWG